MNYRSENNEYNNLRLHNACRSGIDYSYIHSHDQDLRRTTNQQKEMIFAEYPIIKID